jgi:hypothetical protein
MSPVEITKRRDAHTRKSTKAQVTDLACSSVEVLTAYSQLALDYRALGLWKTW